MQANSEYQTASGLAALSICESLLVSLRDLKIMGEKEVVGLLRDASAAHRNVVVSAQDPKTITPPPMSSIASSRERTRSGIRRTKG